MVDEPDVSTRCGGGRIGGGRGVLGAGYSLVVLRQVPRIGAQRTRV